MADARAGTAAGALRIVAARRAVVRTALAALAAADARVAAAQRTIGIGRARARVGVVARVAEALERREAWRRARRVCRGQGAARQSGGEIQRDVQVADVGARIRRTIVARAAEERAGAVHGTGHAGARPGRTGAGRTVAAGSADRAWLRNRGAVVDARQQGHARRRVAAHEVGGTGHRARHLVDDAHRDTARGERERGAEEEGAGTAAAAIAIDGALHRRIADAAMVVGSRTAAVPGRLL